MVNAVIAPVHERLRPSALLVSLYVLLALGTLVALGVLSAAAPARATQEAWVHAVIVAGFAVVLPLRLRAARSGSRDALRAVGVIAGVLAVANLVEAALPGLFPAWMRVEMLGVVAVTAALALTVVHVVRAR